MKVLLISDLHFSSRPQDQHFWDLFNQVIAYIIPNKIDAVFILGDLTTAKDNHAADLVNNLVNNLTNLAKLTKVFILRGNHDGIDAERPYFEFLKHIPNISYLKDISSALGIMCLPHSRNPKEDWKGLNFTNTIVFAHVTVDGAFAESGIKMVSDISSEVFKGARLVFSGDIHAPQDLKYLTYVGAPYNIRFNDNFQGGGIVLDTDTDTWKRITFDFPRRYTLDITDVSDFYKKLESLNPRADDQFKVRLNITNENMGDWRKIQDVVIMAMETRSLKLQAFEMTREPVKVIKTDVPETIVNFDQICTDLKITKELVAVGKQIMDAVK